MANLIIKSSADNLVLQGSDASPAITVAPTGTTTFAESATLANATITAGTIASAVNLNHNAKKNAWHIYRGGNSILYSSDSVLDFDVSKFIGSNVTESGGRITVGSAGLYWIGCAISHNSNQVDTDNFHFRINTTMVIGTTLYQSILADVKLNYSGNSTSFVVELAANDIVDYYGNGHIYGGSGDAMTHFSGCRLGASS